MKNGYIEGTMDQQQVKETIIGDIDSMSSVYVGGRTLDDNKQLSFTKSDWIMAYVNV